MRSILLSALCLSWVFCSTGSAQQLRAENARLAAKDVRIERLVGLAKVWGAVKYFHPFLAYRDLDWDKALVETIPKVNVAATAQEYCAAVNSMLAALNDKNTRAETTGVMKADERPKNVPKDFVRLENGILFVNPTQAVITRERDQDTYFQTLQKITLLLAQAKAVVIDGRETFERGPFPDYYFDQFLHNSLGQILDANVPLGTFRYRLHNGYPMQSGTTVGYYSALVNTTPDMLVGQNKSKTPPIVLLINEQTPIPATMLSGLQAAHKAVVMQDGESPLEPGIKWYEMSLPEGVSVRMRTADPVSRDGLIGFRPDFIAPKSAGEEEMVKEVLKILSGETTHAASRQLPSANAPLVVPKDNPYAEMEFPDAGHRLLALFRFWNVINYFYPYKDLIGGDWDEILPRYIPKFEANKDALDYQMTVREMVAEIHDTHGIIRGTTRVDEKLGTFYPPLIARYVESQTVITNVLDEKAGVRPGDVIVAVDGEPVERRREYLARLFAASTQQDLDWHVSDELLRGPKGSRAILTLKGDDGAIRAVKVERSLTKRDPLLSTGEKRKAPVFTVLTSGLGYVDLDRLQIGEVDKMFETIKGTPGVIFDMRGYPNGTSVEIAPRLTDSTNVPDSLISRRLWEGVNLGESGYTGGANYSFTEYLPIRKGDTYKGKVVTLINEDTSSQAEDTCLLLEAATDVAFIGTATAGVNGDITNTVLPGNILVYFTGESIRHADGRQLQRVGIQPMIKAERTIRGISEGRDEILEAAVKYLRAQVGK